jgi:hypothetical protein
MFVWLVKNSRISALGQRRRIVADAARRVVVSAASEVAV